jgi:fructoselysine 6-phosphate deglycase
VPEPRELAKIAPDYEAIIGRAVSEFQEIQAFVACLPSDLSSVFLIGCGGSHFAAFPAFDLLDRFGSNLSVSLTTSREFAVSKPARLGPRSLIVAASHSGTTPETVEAVRTAKSAGATVVGITRRPGSAMDQMADLHLSYDSDRTAAEPRTLLFDMVALALLARTGDVDLNDFRDALAAAPAALRTTKEEVAEVAAAIGARLAKAPLTYVVAAGAPAGPGGALAACYLQEMIWVDAAYVNAVDFFHGPFEAVTRDSTLIVLVGEDESRPLGERVVRFGRTYSDHCFVLDSRNWTLPGVPSSARWFISPLALAAACNRVRDHAAAATGHDPALRRYMGKVEY